MNAQKQPPVTSAHEGATAEDKAWTEWGVLYNTPDRGYVIVAADREQAETLLASRPAPDGGTAEVVSATVRISGWRNTAGVIVADPEGVPVAMPVDHEEPAGGVG